MNMAQTVTTAGLLKPVRASVGETSPVRVRADRTRSPTTSTGTQPPTKTTRATDTMISKMTSESMECPGKMVANSKERGQ